MELSEKTMSAEKFGEKIAKSDAWVVIRIDKNNDIVETDFSSNLDLDAVDEIILSLAETAMQRQENKK